MRVLVISSTPWANNNSFGSTFSNFFEGMGDVEIANIYCKPGVADGRIVSRAFRITDRDLLKNLMDKRIPAGEEVCTTAAGRYQAQGANIAGYNAARKMRWQPLLWAREFIWRIGRWESRELYDFIDGFKPEVMFQPVYDSFYLTRMALRLQKHTGAPMLGFVGDDVYTLKQFRLSPLYWLDRLLKRVRIKKLILQCDKLYVMTELPKREYDKIFGINSSILTKGLDFKGDAPLKTDYGRPLRLVYTGNVNVGRWKSLAMLGRALSDENIKGTKAELHIYTLTPLTNRMKRAFATPAVRLMDPAPASKMREIQEDADVLVHAEAVDLRYRLAVRLSFSTKLVDYMQRARCILAIGSGSVASIKHLKENDAAIVAENQKQLKQCIKHILNDNELLNKYANNAWICGKAHHQQDKTQQMLYNDMRDAISGVN